MEKKRLFNKRPTCFAVFFLLLGILIGESCYGEYKLLRLIPLCLVFASFIMLLSFKNTRRFAYLPLFLVCGIISICASNDIFDSKKYSAVNSNMQATVSSEIIVENDNAYFFVDEITLENGMKLKGKAVLYCHIYSEPDYNAGDVIKLKGNITSILHNRFDTYGVSWRAKNINFKISALETPTKIAEKSPSFPLSFQMLVKKIFYENSDENTASICQALILGDKNGMDDGLYDNIKNSGVAHILAVSGLHITALSTALYFLLNKLKVNKKWSFLIVLVLTFFYVMLCGFTPSSVRAFIMSSIFTFGSAWRQKNDSLTSLSLASLLILFFRPTALMEVGFLLSVFSILGIIMLYKPMMKPAEKFLDKVSPKKHIGKKCLEMCAVSISTNVYTYPFVAYFFKAIPVLFILTNLFLVPYMMSIYIILLVLTAFALITGLYGTVFIMNYLLVPLKAISSLVGNLSFATASVSISVVGMVFMPIILIVSSRFIFLKKSSKIVLILSLATLWIFILSFVLMFG